MTWEPDLVGFAFSLYKDTFLPFEPPPLPFLLTFPFFFSIFNVATQGMDICVDFGRKHGRAMMRHACRMR